jgi:uncharacterized protein
MSKISRYNHFQPWRDGYHIAYNALSGAVALMTDENYHVYQRIVDKMSSSDTPDFTDEEKELVKQLEYGRFINTGGHDEVEGLEFQHYMDRYDRSGLGLIIAPTLACNMACKYCYEENKKGRLSAQLIERIVEFVEERAPSLSRLDVSWYGGEPLLAMDIVEDLSETFMDLAEEYKFDYGASIISNGYLLTPEKTDKLKDLKVRTIQITVDGPEKMHNEKRPLKNGKPSFRTIIDNMKYAADKLGIGIRINVDKTFTSDIITELLQEFIDAGLRDKLGVYFGQLEASTQVCSNISEACYDTADFSQIETEFYKILLDKGFRIDRLPSPMSTFCMAQLVNSFLIDPQGNIYKCFNHVGSIDKTMGNITEAIDFMHPNFRRLFTFNPFQDATCRECDNLPVCMGGCPSRRADRHLTGEQMCDSWKHNLEPMLEIIALSRQQQQQRQQEEEAVAAKE